MPVITNIPIHITAQEIVTARSGQTIRPELLRYAEEAVELASTLWQPRAVYEWVSVQAFDAESLRVASPNGGGREATLQIGQKAHLIEPAERVLVAVGTLGPALEQKTHQLQAAGENLQSFFLDSAGVVALGTVGESLRCIAEELANEHGWGVGPAMSPGSLVGWPLQGQKELCSLLDLDQIGVKLSSYHVLEPHKSFSSVIGVGPGFASKQVGSVCKYCALQNTCWRRREDPS